MKFVLASLTLFSVIIFGSIAIAHDHDDERISHYAVDKPQDAASAIALLQSKTDEIGAILANATLDSNALEAIHEKTYALEAAIEALEKIHSNDSREHALEAAEEAIEELHEASEDHKEAEVRQWYAALLPSIELVKNAFANEVVTTPSSIR